MDLAENLLSQVTKSDVLAGQIYQFRYRAVNRQGPGPYSQIAQLKAANVPAQMNAVITRLVGVDLQITWSRPDSGSLTIESYLVEIESHDGIFRNETDYCDGGSA